MTWTHKLMMWYIRPPPSSGLGRYYHKWLLGSTFDQIKGSRLVWESEKVNLAITYRKKLDPKKQTIIQEWEMTKTSRGPSTNVQVKEGVSKTSALAWFSYVHLHMHISLSHCAVQLLLLWLGIILLLLLYLLWKMSSDC